MPTYLLFFGSVQENILKVPRNYGAILFIPKSYRGGRRNESVTTLCLQNTVWNFTFKRSFWNNYGTPPYDNRIK